MTTLFEKLMRQNNLVKSRLERLSKFVDSGKLTKEEAVRIATENRSAVCTKCENEVAGDDDGLCGSCV